MGSNNLKKNTYLVAVGQVAQKVLAFALIPFAARYLGDDGFGKFSLASSIMFFIFLFNDLGVNTYITREVAKNKKIAEHYYFNSLLIKIGLIVFDFLLLLFFLQFANYDSDTDFAILIFAGYGITTSIMQLSIGIFESYERMEYEAVILTLEKVIITSLSIFVLIKGYGLIVFCGTFLFGGLISILLSFFILKKYFNFKKENFHPSFEQIKNLVMHSIPFGASIFLSTIYNNVGILILSLLTTTDVVGWFSASYRFIAITNIVPMILIAATYPALSREMFHSDERVAEIFTKCFKYLTFIAFPMVIGTVILSDKIIYLIYGAKFGNSILPLKILSIAAALVFYNIFFTGVFKAANLQKLMVKIQVIGLFINIPCNLILIHFHSYIGAAITTVVTESFILVSFFIITYRRIVKLQESAFLIKTLVSTGLMAIFAYYFKNLNVYAVVVGSVVLFFGSLYIMKGFILKELLPVSSKY